MGAVAHGVDGGVRGPRCQIDDDPVGAGKPGCACQSITRRSTDADQHRVARDSGAVRQAHPGHPAGGAAKLLHRGVQNDANAGARVMAVEELGQRQRCHARQHSRLTFDYNDFGAKHARRRGDLQTDIAGADDRDARARAQQRPEAVGIGKRAQFDDAREVVPETGSDRAWEPVARIRWS